MPKLNALHKKYNKSGFVLIGVHSDPDTKAAMKAVTQLKIAYPVAYDTGKQMQAFGCTSYPSYVIVDRKGIVRAVDLDEGHLEKAVKMFLAKKA